MNTYENALECAQKIKAIYSESIDFAVVLGSGLSNFEKEIEVIHSFDYVDLPYFPISTVQGHKGKLIIGKVKGKTVICQSGRFHYYEGYTMEQVTFPIRVFKLLGIDKLVVTNAAGGLNPNQEVGDIVIIRDHINLQPEHPLRGKNDDRFGPRFPDMMHAYCPDFFNKAIAYAKSKNYRCELGVYVGVQGPTYETPAEYQMFHRIGGDAVGMSTVPEVIVASHMSMKVFAISIIADCGYPLDKLKVISHQEVLDKSAEAEPKVTDIVTYIIQQF
ncbi:MAG: purine-nucleoside phosphorylase [Chitinophagales bacterium]|nr:purine-nucleoside phosphorylase [Sphingobacteriales bacterium]